MNCKTIEDCLVCSKYHDYCSNNNAKYIIKLQKRIEELEKKVEFLKKETAIKVLEQESCEDCVSREEQIQDYERKKLIEELSKMPLMVISTAYLHALNYTLYGEDVTEKWLTATQNSSALEKAYRKGYYDALQR